MGCDNCCNQAITLIDPRTCESILFLWSSGGLAIDSGKWENPSMAEKRTKADKALRQADKLDRKARHPAAKRKKAPR